MKNWHPRIVSVDPPSKAARKSLEEIFKLDVRGRPTVIYRIKGRPGGYVSTKHGPGEETFFSVSGFWLMLFEAIAEQSKKGANENLIGLVRKHFGGIEPAPPVGVKTKSRFSFDRLPENGEIPCFEDFIASGGRIEYVPPFDERTGLPLNGPKNPFEDMDDEEDDDGVGPVEEHHKVIDRMNLSFASPLSGALRPEAPATQDDVFELATALSKEIRRMNVAFERITKRLNERVKK